MSKTRNFKVKADVKVSPYYIRRHVLNLAEECLDDKLEDPDDVEIGISAKYDEKFTTNFYSKDPDAMNHYDFFFSITLKLRVNIFTEEELLDDITSRYDEELQTANIFGFEAVD